MTTNVLEYLENTTKKYPEKIGFQDENEEMTFLKFQSEAKKVAMIIPREMKREPIVVFMKKGIKELVTFMGIVYSGNYYVPIEPDSPLERMLNILNVIEAKFIISDAIYADRIKEKVGQNITIVNYEPHINAYIDEAYLLQTRNNHLDTDPLYVLFTSGSTGIPKGVIISHRSVIDYAEWCVETFDFSRETVFANQSSFCFDNSVLEIYSTLKAGATLYIMPEKLFVFPRKVLEALEDKKVNTIFWVPSVLVSIANANILSEYILSDLKKILFCGEVMPNKQLNVWRKQLPDAFYANLYGPTEITDVCAYYIVDREFQDEDMLPIGKACKNTQILVLNEKNEMCKSNEIGEICVKGTCLSLGYYGDWGRTEQVFVQNPLNNKWKELLYRTGDLANYNERGELLYLGRKDFQIKHNGYRIELGEIESAAYALEEMQQCCALYNEEKKQIVLFSVLSNTRVSEKDIYECLKKKVPKYMLPAVIVVKEKLELNENGKIDKVKLKKEMDIL